MKTYNVKQIAEMLETNQETVRRWIRDGKLKAIQPSKKEGNVVSQAQLDAFLKLSPKYLPKFAVGLAALSPLVSITALATSGIAAAVLMKYYKDKHRDNTKVSADDVKGYLQNQIAKEEADIEKKKELIQKIQSEITDMSIQVEKYKYLLSNDGALNETINVINETTEKNSENSET